MTSDLNACCPEIEQAKTKKAKKEKEKRYSTFGSLAYQTPTQTWQI